MYLIRGGPSLMVSALVSETGGPDSSVTALYGVTFLKKRFSVKTRNAVLNYICDFVTKCPHNVRLSRNALKSFRPDNGNWLFPSYPVPHFQNESQAGHISRFSTETKDNSEMGYY